MKHFISVICAIMCYLGAFAETPVEYYSVGDTIKFCGTDFTLAWSSHPKENFYMQEYLPQGETFDHFTQMFTVSIIISDLTPLEAMQAKIEELEKRKKNDPVINYQTLDGPNGEYMLDFIVSDSNGQSLSMVEVDIHHYRQMTFNGRKALVVTFYTRRAYGDDILPFIKSLPETRVEWYLAMAKLNLDPKFVKE